MVRTPSTGIVILCTKSALYCYITILNSESLTFCCDFLAKIIMLKPQHFISLALESALTIIWSLYINFLKEAPVQVLRQTTCRLQVCVALSYKWRRRVYGNSSAFQVFCCHQRICTQNQHDKPTQKFKDALSMKKMSHSFENEINMCCNHTYLSRKAHLFLVNFMYYIFDIKSNCYIFRFFDFKHTCLDMFSCF